MGSAATGSQSIIYNKGDEARLRNPVVFAAYNLDCTDRTCALWRFEVRFRGPVLKQRYRVINFDDLGAQIHSMLSWATDRIRYAAPDQERVHPTRRMIDPFCRAIRDSIPTFRMDQPSLILPYLAQELLDREMMALLESSTAGSLISRVAMNGLGDPDRILSTLPDYAADLMRRRISEYPERTRAKIDDALARYAVRHPGQTRATAE